MSTRARKTRKSERDQKTGEGVSDDVRLLRLRSHLLDASARSAVRSAGMLREAFRVRRDLADFISVFMKRVASVDEHVVAGKFVPGDEQCKMVQELTALGHAEACAVAESLKYFRAQVASLSADWRVIRQQSAVGSFRDLRGVSLSLLSDSSQETRSLWRYVLLAWEKLDPEASRIALWQPQLDATREDRFRFDEGGQTWVYERDDGSSATLHVGKATAVAKE